MFFAAFDWLDRFLLLLFCKTFISSCIAERGVKLRRATIVQNVSEDRTPVSNVLWHRINFERVSIILIRPNVIIKQVTCEIDAKLNLVLWNWFFTRRLNFSRISTYRREISHEPVNLIFYFKIVFVTHFDGPTRNLTWVREIHFLLQVWICGAFWQFNTKFNLGSWNSLFIPRLNLSPISTYRRKIELGLMKLAFYSKFKFVTHFEVRHEILFRGMKLNFTRKLNFDAFWRGYLIGTLIVCRNWISTYEKYEVR